MRFIMSKLKVSEYQAKCHMGLTSVRYKPQCVIANPIASIFHQGEAIL